MATYGDFPGVSMTVTSGGSINPVKQVNASIIVGDVEPELKNTDWVIFISVDQLEEMTDWENKGELDKLGDFQIFVWDVPRPLLVHKSILPTT